MERTLRLRTGAMIRKDCGRNCDNRYEHNKWYYHLKNPSLPHLSVALLCPLLALSGSLSRRSLRRNNFLCNYLVILNGVYTNQLFFGQINQDVGSLQATYFEPCTGLFVWPIA